MAGPSLNPLKAISDLERVLAVLPRMAKDMRKMTNEVVLMREAIDELPALVGKLVETVEILNTEVRAMHADVVVIGDHVQPLAEQLDPLAPTLAGLEPRLGMLLEEMQGMRNDLGRLPFVGRRRPGIAKDEPAVQALPPHPTEVPDPADVSNDAA
jgi:hypothetical protein